ncbi:MBL fold metallo-hydrolase [Anaerolineales bacterium HSG6]|nr:MBL fold metallo-hydrolase [Anaerolineales bacterium HSG6]MDM8531028.1 MBL fold metallo-hydrolase [Anaerolineales bacterium HSG25]
MKIKFWGTRGSIPTAISSDYVKQKIRQALEGAAGLDLDNEAVLNRYLDRLPITVAGTAGGNTPCIEIRSDDQLLIIDAGSGLRVLGLDLMGKGFAKGHHRADFLITHTHWDHIQGFPFFTPAFIPHNRFTFYSPFEDLEDRLRKQQDELFFPVPTSYMSARFKFNIIKPNEWYEIGRFKVYPMRLSHPGIAYGYRIDDGEKSIVCATDSEYKRVDPASTEEYVKLFKDTDLLIFDAQYSLTQALDRPDWGHSTALMGAELARRAGAKQLALSHHDPTSSDETIWEAKDQAEAYFMHHPSEYDCEVIVAYDGLTIEV